MTAQILDCTPDDYYARPGFSSTVAKVLLARSALHAKASVGMKPSGLLDRGSIIHRLVLGKGKDYAIVEANDWRTNVAKAARADARAKGLTPVLADDFEDYSKASAAISTQLADRGIVLDGDSEVAIEWMEGALQCKGMPDHLWIGDGVILDLKVTENACPDAIERTAENLGYALQAAAYSRALAAVRPDLAGRVKFLFAFCEPDAPHAMNICETSGVFRELGERRWLRACAEWQQCIERDRYPGYDEHGINHINPPAWALAREGYTIDER